MPSHEVVDILIVAKGSRGVLPQRGGGSRDIQQSRNKMDQLSEGVCMMACSPAAMRERYAKIADRTGKCALRWDGPMFGYTTTQTLS